MMTVPIYMAEDTITHPERSDQADWMLAGNRLTKSEETLRFEE